jgi:hypothetical protein
LVHLTAMKRSRAAVSYTVSWPEIPSKINYTVKKKVSGFPIPSLDVTNQLSLASDIPAGDGKTAGLFL